MHKFFLAMIFISALNSYGSEDPSFFWGNLNNAKIILPALNSRKTNEERRRKRDKSFHANNILREIYPNPHQFKKYPSLLKVPFEVQKQVLAQLDIRQLLELAQASEAYENLVKKYGKEITELNLANNNKNAYYCHIDALFTRIDKIAEYFPNLQRLIIGNEGFIASRRAYAAGFNFYERNVVTLIRKITTLFPKLTYLRITDLSEHLWEEVLKDFEEAHKLLAEWAQGPHRELKLITKSFLLGSLCSKEDQIPNAIQLRKKAN